jgi:hypothetical protein
MKRIFTSEDQQAFARLSGDYNPLHMDPLAARRLMFGRQIVHGMHLLLWGLDQYFTVAGPSRRISTVRAGFQSGVGIGEEVDCYFEADEENRLELRLKANDTTAAWSQLTWHTDGHAPQRTWPQKPPPLPNCRERPIEELEAAAGSLPLYADEELAEHLFPNLSIVLPPVQLSQMLATTRLVGMECPGRHSIFSGFELTYSAAPTPLSDLDYRVVTCNPKLSVLLMRIRAAGMEGKIKAFLRPDARQQAAFSEIGDAVGPGEFADQQAVIIGGSRGLGEVTAKLLAAGGAGVVITFNSGDADARRVVADIASGGAEAASYRMDVLNADTDLANQMIAGSRPAHLYYFATPPIFGGARSRFSLPRFNTFCDYYVGGFLKTVEMLALQPRGLERIFYPSTTAIDEMPSDMGEYAAAKAAGERLCDFLRQTRPALKIHRPRLPRLATDQTVSLLPVENQDPVSILLPHLRALRDL